MFKLFSQIVDFIVKAMLAYAATPEGQKELRDIEIAAEGTPFDMTPDSTPSLDAPAPQTVAGLQPRRKALRAEDFQ